MWTACTKIPASGSFIGRFFRTQVNASRQNFEYAKKLFEDHGYKLPQVVFWNVQSRNQQQPVKMNEQGVILVSGCTPRLFSMVASGQFDPAVFMKEVLLSKRYEPICA